MALSSKSDYTCGPNEWKCKTSGMCIPIESRCDGFDEDCGEDEENWTGWDVSDEENCKCVIDGMYQNKPSVDCPSENPICAYGKCKENAMSEDDPCTPDYCMNGGTCVVRADAPNNAACDCQSTFTGERCENTCESCYGAESSTIRCCQTCNEVVQAFKEKGLNYNTTDFRQCDDSGINENNDNEYGVIFQKCCWDPILNQDEPVESLASAESLCTKDPKCVGVMKYKGQSYEIYWNDFALCYDDYYIDDCSNGIYFDKKQKSKFLNSKAIAQRKPGYRTEVKNIILGSGNIVRGARPFDGYHSFAGTRSAQNLNHGNLWSPNVESVFKFALPNLIEALKKSEQHTPNFAGYPLKLAANVKVQAFNDKTLRVKINQIRFYSNGSKISIEKAHQILEHERSNEGAIGHTVITFKKMLTMPFLLHAKRGLVKKLIVSQNEPAEVTEIKKLVALNLEKKRSPVFLQLITKKSIMVPLKTPKFPMRVDIGNCEDNNYSTQIKRILFHGI